MNENDAALSNAKIVAFISVLLSPLGVGGLLGVYGLYYTVKNCRFKPIRKTWYIYLLCIAAIAGAVLITPRLLSLSTRPTPVPVL